MKGSTVCKVAFTATLAIAVVALAFVAVRTVNPAAFANMAERIPGLRRFVIKTYPTRVFAMAETEANVLKVARYDIDFLASFTGKDGRYVALFPFTVEAEIPLGKIGPGETAGTLAVPEPEYVASLDQGAAASMVFMDTLELDYNKMLAPVLSMYREKSVDLALSDRAFAADCKKKTGTYLAEIFGAKEISWKAGGSGGTGESDDNRTTSTGTKISSRSLPVVFQLEGDRGRTIFFDTAAGTATGASGTSGTSGTTGMAASSLRDAFAIRTTRFGSPQSVRFRFGRAGTMRGSFADFADRIATQGGNAPKDRIVFRYHDPMSDGDMTFASFADNGFREAFVYLRGGSDVYYVDAASKRDFNDETVAQNIAPTMLYLAASAMPSDAAPDAEKSYDEYCRQYDTALAEVKARRYGRQLEIATSALDRISMEATGQKSDDADIIRKIMNLKNGSAGLIGAIVENEAGSLESGSDGDLRGNVEALLWSMRGELGIPEETAQGYQRDLVSKGTAMNRTLAESLSPAERNSLYANFFLAHLPADKPRALYVGEDGTAETWLYYGEAAVKWKEKTTQRRVAEKLDLKKVLGSRAADGAFIFVFSEPEDRTGFFTQYHALVLDGERVTYCRNFARWLPFTGGETSAKFGDLAFTDGSVTVGKKSMDGKPEIARALKPFRDAFASDGYTKERVVELVSGNLEKEAVALLERPRFE